MSEFLRDGHSTVYEFSNHPDVLLIEIEVTAPGIDGGPTIPQTSMRNEAWETHAPRALKTFSVGKATVAYNPAVLEEAMEMVLENQLITIVFPDGDSWVFWGYVSKFIPGNKKHGDRPVADIEVQPSLLNESWEETPPVHNAA